VLYDLQKRFLVLVFMVKYSRTARLTARFFYTKKPHLLELLKSPNGANIIPCAAFVVGRLLQWGTSKHFNDNYAQTLIDARHLIYPRQLPLRQAAVMGWANV